MPPGRNTATRTKPHPAPGRTMPAAMSHYFKPADAVLMPPPAPDTPLDTLAQLRKLARSKFISNGLVFRLIDLELSPLRKSYWNSFHCARVLDQDGLKISGHHCNNRWCLVCNRIRTAKLINGYMPVLKKMQDRYFVTLTIPNVPAAQLSDALDDMHQAFRLIKERHRKRKQPITGLRKLEITYNPKRKDYHPHYHCIVIGEQSAADLITSWLAHFPKAARAAQDMRPADVNSCKELFKYFTKLVTKNEQGNNFHAESLDVIFQAMRKRRTFQAMGIKKISEDVPTVQEYPALKVAWKKWTFNDITGDWTDGAGGQLAQYFPSEAVRQLRGKVAHDWQLLDAEFSAVRRFDQREYWKERTEHWTLHADKIEKRAALVDAVFETWINST